MIVFKRWTLHQGKGPISNVGSFLIPAAHTGEKGLIFQDDYAAVFYSGNLSQIFCLSQALSFLEMKENTERWLKKKMC